MNNNNVVWVTVGKTRHPARVLETAGDKSRVQWTLTVNSNKTDWVDNDQIIIIAQDRMRRGVPILYEWDNSDNEPITNLVNKKRPRPVSSSPGVINSARRIRLATQEQTIPRQAEARSSSHSSVGQQFVDFCSTAESSNQVIDLCDDDDDEDRSSSPSLVTDPRGVSVESVTSATSSSDEDNLDKKPSADARSATSQPAEDDTSPTNQGYSLKSSAYLQNLAEICFTILCDQRWVGLFRWECGDDLSVAKAFSGHFVPQPPPISFPCQCLLCKDEPHLETTNCGNSIAHNQGVGRQSIWEEEDSDEVRGLYLYSRLYYRKGPWFRIDNIYRRYYLPKKASDRNNEGPSSAETAIVDETVIQKHMSEYVPRMLKDLQTILAAGHIRGFDSELECGKVVGLDLLTGEERGVLLTKLGASKKQKSFDRNENTVLKQMTQQRSLFSTAKHLPVQCHVQDILLESLSKFIVRSASQADYIPVQTLKPAVASVKSAVQKLIKAQFGSLFMACCRLREQPLLTLQRCVRLYLCATSGPGEMRGDGTNGWRSLREAESTASPYNRLVPPGQHSWHQIQYPALAYRFGLQSSCFIHSYRHIPIEDATQEIQTVFQSRESFLRWEICAELRATVDYVTELNEMQRYDERRVAKGKDAFKKYRKPFDIDSLGLLTLEGRAAFFSPLFRNQDALYRPEIVADIDECSKMLDRECEKLLGIVGIVIMYILDSEISDDTVNPELAMLTARPWLRHLCWQACLAYILWDVLPIFERAGLYRFAVQCLEVLLFGSRQRRDADWQHLDMYHLKRRKLSKLPLISRRAAGKAVDRLIIDFTHFYRSLTADKEKREKKALLRKLQNQIFCLCQYLVERASPTSSIGFSTLRKIARRLKQPLTKTMEHFHCLEATTLGLRLGGSAALAASEISNKYSDWTGIVDVYQANALVNEETSRAGARCAFVGCEDEGDSMARTTSLNVEELAMELYHTGRLPEVDSEVGGGGWHGFHDEGGHLRALFRIVCGASILGMDFGCEKSKSKAPGSSHAAMIYLSPYQSAPFDLHVGFQLRDASNGEAESSQPTGLFFRQSDRINQFLMKIESLNNQAIADLVREAISCRLQFMQANRMKDPFLDRDLKQVRTLSAIAAGLGGKLLAAASRCLLFDYRHYSGGLPDLLLFRAVQSSSTNNRTFVDLGEWIGESFSIEHQQQVQAQKAADILIDRDDEFLGCSKVGDSGGQNSRSRRMAAGEIGRSTEIPSMDKLPDRLELTHESTAVKVECMFVEVKSSNDRLDPRQEDWLNILDRHGNARVCKFVSSTKKTETKV